MTNTGRKKIRILGLAVSYTAISVTSFIIAFPFIWMLSNSIKTNDEIWAMPPKFLPAAVQWQNYTAALVDSTFFKYMWNSFYTSAIITILVLINSAMFAYAITQIRFKFRNFLFILVMITYIMPGATTHIPSYVILAKLHLINTHFGLIISSAASIFNIFYFRQAFLQVNRGILDAARIDGAGHWTILWRIMVPITIPSFAALGILGFVGSYNSYIWPSLILKSKTNFIVSMGLQSFFYVEGAYGLKWGTIMAACGVVIFPLLFIFIIAERWIIYSISSESAVKE